MSYRRCLTAGLTPLLSFLFFIPFVNYFLMIFLGIFPGKEANASSVAPSFLGSVVAGAILPSALALIIIIINVEVMKRYGVAVFVGLPVAIGFSSAFLVNRQTTQSMRKTLGISLVSIAVFGGVLLLFAAEGMVCIAMAAPICIVLGMLGALLGRTLALAQRPRLGAVSCIALFAVLPLVSVIEASYVDKIHTSVISEITVEAPVEKVWENVIAFPELDSPSEWYFRAGIAYPTGAKIEGRGIGSVRYCQFSTGPFVEPVTKWEEPTLLAFDVQGQPDPIGELTFYSGLHPSHLEFAFRSTHGEFRLERLSATKTRIVGTTWYDLEIKPGFYWKALTDEIVHRIHMRVLKHIKKITENA